MNAELITTAVVGGFIFSVLGRKVLKRRVADVGQLVCPPRASWLWGHEREAWEAPNSEWYVRNTEEIRGGEIYRRDWPCLCHESGIISCRLDCRDGSESFAPHLYI